MRIRIKNLSFLLILAMIGSSIMFTSCQGAKGDRGEIGPTGPRGEIGPPGPQGPPGNANVKMHQFNVSLNDFVRDNDNRYWNFHRIPGADIDLGDAVLMYKYTSKYGGSSSFYANMAFSEFWGSGTLDYNHHSFEIADDNNVLFFIRRGNGGAPYSNMSTGAISYRAVIIKGNGKKSLIPEDLDISNYKEVAQYFGLPQ